MRVKILDAWAHGLPVISTRIGAEGLECEDNHDLLIADEPQAMIAAINELMIDQGKAEFIARNGRKRVLSSYNWRKRYQEWFSIYA